MKSIVINIVFLCLIAIVSCNYLPYGVGPNSANGRAIGGTTPQASGSTVSSGLGPSINVNPVNNAESRSNAQPSNYQQASLSPGLGSPLRCGFGLTKLFETGDDASIII